jgi:hypothetical protein
MIGKRRFQKLPTRLLMIRVDELIEPENGQLAAPISE